MSAKNARAVVSGPGDLTPGRYILNGSGDLGIEGRIRRYFGKEVDVIKKCKSGLYYIFTENDGYWSVPKHNLEVPEEYHARIERYRNRTPEDIERERIAMSKWKVEAAQDLQAMHGLDLEREITKLLGKQFK